MSKRSYNPLEALMLLESLNGVLALSLHHQHMTDLGFRRWLEEWRLELNKKEMKASVRRFLKDNPQPRTDKEEWENQFNSLVMTARIRHKMNGYRVKPTVKVDLNQIMGMYAYTTLERRLVRCPYA